MPRLPRPAHRSFAARSLARAAAASLVGVVVMGCQPSTPAGAQKQLDDATAAFASKDYPRAIREADAVIAATPTGPAAVDAYYIKGRALEDTVSKGNAEAAANLNAARQAYTQALAAGPNPQQEGLIRASLADVCYWQDDYATAADEGRKAEPLLKAPGQKAWVLYRLGLSLQRQGRFVEADQTFNKVIATYPNTEQARRAEARKEMRAFVVQLATFSGRAGADKLSADIRKAGLTPQVLVDPQGRHVVSVGPLVSYDEARGVKAKFAAQYPDAVIIP
jgi:tetratricopeptide (TPR) repeat protein